MKVSEVKKWLKKNKKRLIYQYGLDEWIINITVKNIDETENCYGDSESWWNYHKAEITLYAKKHKSLLELEHTLRHELCHIVLAPSQELEDGINVILKKLSNTYTRLLIGQLHTIFAEHGVLMLEKMSRRHRGLK